MHTWKKSSEKSRQRVWSPCRRIFEGELVCTMFLRQVLTLPVQ